MPILRNARHEAFAQALAGGKTAAQAYVLAGYKPNDGNAARLRANDRVTARVAEILGKAAARVEVSISDIMEELRRIGFSDIRRAVKWHGSLIQEVVSSSELDSDTAAAIAEISSSPTGGLRIKFHNKKEALVALAALKRATEEGTAADQ